MYAYDTLESWDVVALPQIYTIDPRSRRLRMAPLARCLRAIHRTKQTTSIPIKYSKNDRLLIFLEWNYKYRANEISSRDRR